MKEKDKPLGRALDQTFRWGEALDALADAYNGFLFWSILTSLGVTVWYFPLWHMGISGYEVFVMSTVSPFFLGIGSISSWVRPNVRVVHLLSLVGLFAYAIKGPELRLFTVGFAVAMQCLAWAATWHAARQHPARLEARALAWSCGLVLSSVAKFACQTNNPVWPIMHPDIGGWNKTAAAIAVLAALRATRRPDLTDELKVEDKPPRSAFLPALGLAGLFFGMHSMLSDSSTMILWVWDGFPVRGPIAVHGVVTIAAMCGGLLAGVYYKERLTAPVTMGMVAAGAFLVTSYHHWTGYLGALAFTFSIMSLAPALISSAAQCRLAVVFGVGFLLYNILVLAHVWVVAYAFVPGGPLMREHTDWVVTATVLFLGAGVLGVPPTKKGSKQPPSTFKDKPRVHGRSRGFYYAWLLAAVQLLAVAIAYLRFPANNYAPHHAAEKALTAGIWTIHFSLDNDMYSSERRMRDLLRELELDVVGLLESDLQRVIMGNRDTTQFLAEDLGMYVAYGPGPDKHTWGAALLSRFPILNSTHHLLPSPVGELAPAIHATLDAYGEPVDVVVFHSGQEEDPEDRRLQSEYLARLMRDSPRPLILLSYLVTKPQDGN